MNSATMNLVACQVSRSVISGNGLPGTLSSVKRNLRHMFSSLAQARVVISDWKTDYIDR